MQIQLTHRIIVFHKWCSAIVHCSCMNSFWYTENLKLTPVTDCIIAYYKSSIMTTERFCLKWNDFTSNVSHSFSKLRNETKMADVTLMGNDHKLVSAHKLVLSACSEFFKNIFMNNSNNNNLVLFLDGVDSTGITLMLDYIYQGEAQIYQEYLDGFLELAKKFQLDSLLENKNEGETEMKPFEQSQPVNIEYNTFEQNQKMKPVAPRIQRDVKDRTLKLLDESILSSNSEVEEKFRELIVIGEPAALNNSCHACDKVFQDLGELYSHLNVHKFAFCEHCNTMVPKRYFPQHKIKCSQSPKDLSCHICNTFSTRWKSALRKHIKTMHGEHSTKCNICGKAFRNAISLENHMRKHNGYDCSTCGRNFKSRQALDYHRKANHVDTDTDDTDDHRSSDADDLFLSSLY